MSNYVKHYASDYADLLPFIMANALKTGIIVIEYNDEKVIQKMHNVKPVCVLNDLKVPLLLFKCKDHYEACLMKKCIPTPNVTVNDAFSTIKPSPTVCNERCTSSTDVNTCSSGISQTNPGTENGPTDGENTDIFPSVRLFRNYLKLLK